MKFKRERTNYKYAKIFGERNSGTNFIEQILRRNFNVRMLQNAGPLSAQQRNNLRNISADRETRARIREVIYDEIHKSGVPSNGGWKHSALTLDTVSRFQRFEESLVLCVVRHPVSWALSMHHNPFHALVPVSNNFSEFIRSPWISSPRDCLQRTVLSSPLLLWKLKLQSYIAAHELYPNVEIIRYEDVLSNPAEYLTQLPLQNKWLEGEFFVPTQNSRTFVGSGTTTEAYRNSLEIDAWGQVSPEDKTFLKETLGNELNELYGYE